jgi:2-dehydropantoate 2-reductase
MKVVVVGAGAVGGFFGGLLHKAGEEVSFLARGKHLQAMKNNGLSIKSELSTFTVNAQFTDQYDDISTADLVLLTVKSTETKRTIEKIKPYIRKKDSYILTLQNGVDNEEILSEHFGVEKVLTGSAYLSSEIEKPGYVLQQGKHAVIIGKLHESQHDIVKEVNSVFQNANINSLLSDNIMRRKWEKLLWNVTFNPLSAVAETTVGEILADQHLKSIADNVITEAINIAEKTGITFQDDIVKRVFADAHSVKEHKTSMLQDKLKGKPMEIESLCGFFVHKGKELGVDVPVLGTLYSLLSFIDTKVDKND